MNLIRRFSILVCGLLLFCAACSNKQTQFTPAGNSLDAAREFIDGCLKGDFDKANYYMQKDAENLSNLEKMKASYEKKSKNDRKQYQQASIIIEEIDSVNDSTDIINYKNSFDRIARKVKVVKGPDGWIVDFKYTISGNI
ncbi:hypothetical protein HNQ91_000905 [Filimonas zeae]|uniref:DUF4878 domain-containing protein n=1 Tax=Filimonas zeae TaxID=1737353 RepID=A0A917MSD3_9BACT|nr:DUF4878 domain-containing protein [Filimonas zeae]MDR6337883.1 hypothetical protein [Filimonas zeae]GGH60708.1 hypothetical protein GCM10011379_08870 [Filimonas zeae]